MIHARAPHFLWPYALRYAVHQLNLQPCVSRLEVSPTSLWTGSPAGGAATGSTRSGGASSRGAGAGGAGACGASSRGAGVGGCGKGCASSGGARAGGAGTRVASFRGAGAGGASFGGASGGGTGTGGASSRGAGAGGTDVGGAGTEETGAGGSPTTSPTARPHRHDTRFHALRWLEREEQERVEQERQELGLRALGLPSSPPVHSQSPTAYGPTFPPPDSTPTVFSPPQSPSPPPVVPHDWTSRCPPCARPSSPLADLCTVLFHSPPRRSPPMSVLPSPPKLSLTVSSHPITNYYRAARPLSPVFSPLLSPTLVPLRRLSRLLLPLSLTLLPPAVLTTPRMWWLLHLPILCPSGLGLPLAVTS
ncbi:unnamed protein product [Closterium sp. NIES-53]